MSGTRRVPQSDSTLVGSRVADRYLVTALIGHGGMAEVYRATDETLGREVALKIFRPEYASAQDLDRQQGEVRLLAKLSHPCLVTLFDATADADGRAVLVLEYVSGTDARHRLQAGALDAAAVAAIGGDAARALAYIHSQGVIHRDVSPANLLLPDSPHAVAAKLTDLGIARIVDEARLTATGLVTGTASYMSPEQVAGRPLTGASDVYSLGLVLLEALTGRREFPGKAVEAASARLARDPRIPAELGPVWAGLLSDMTARDPARRPSAQDVAARLGDMPEDVSEIASAPVETQAITRTMPASDSDDPQSTGATLLMPEAPPVPPLPPVPPPVVESPAEPVTRRRSRPKVLLLVAALVAAVAIVVVAFTVIPAANHPTPDPVRSYPAVGGQLGEHLKQLERQVSTTTTP